MNFLLPGMLWGLLAILPLVAVYFLRIRPRRRPVTAFFLWRKILEKKKASSLFQRLRDAFSLLMMLLVLLCAVFAAAGLSWTKEDRRDVLVIVDGTASMMAKHQGKTIYEQAVGEVKNMIRAMNGSRRMALASVSDDLRFVSHFSENPRDLLQAAMILRAQDSPLSESALRAVNEFATASQKKFRIVLITDGRRGWEKLSPSVEVLRIGNARAENAGIIAADLEWSGVAGDRARFFYKISNTYDKAMQVDMELRHTDSSQIMRLIPVQLKAGEEVTDSLEMDGAQAGRWSASLLIDDSLSCDNEVMMGLPERNPIKVNVAMKDGYFYQRCVEAFQNATGALELSKADAQIHITTGKAQADVPSIVFAPDGGEALDVLVVEPKLISHPVIKNVDCDALSFEGAKKCTLPNDALVILATDTGEGLIWKHGNSICINLDPTAGNFFLSPWFPVLVHNSALHLAGRETSVRGVYSIGEKVSMIGGAAAPDGTAINDPDFLVSQVGHWQNRMGDWFGVSLLAREESALDSQPLNANAKEVERGHPPMLWLLWLALFLLASEAYLYHRRKAG